ncbi:LysR substrate-binding domain-containing protein [Streptomyces sp. NPDC001797]|uniref:LysR substrate-binding domain-containing protein n=1 Tax=Streptomyces sp. NPDC001797 TaxID=3364610 RepID=UPI0036BE34C6
MTLRSPASEIVVDFPAGTAGRVQTDQAFAAAGIERDVAFEVSTTDFTVPLVASGLGVAMMPSGRPHGGQGTRGEGVAEGHPRYAAPTPRATDLVADEFPAGEAPTADMAFRSRQAVPHTARAR